MQQLYRTFGGLVTLGKSWPLVVALLSYATAALAQLNGGSNNINYVNSQAVQVAGKKTEADLANLPKESLTQTITFMDGLARPRQVVASEASPAGGDIIQPLEYDSRGRVARSYLPYHAATNLLQYRTNALTG